MENKSIAAMLFVGVLVLLLGVQPEAIAPVAPNREAKLPAITTKVPAYLDYAGIIQQLKRWNSEAEDFTDFGSYGKTTRNADIVYLRVGNMTRIGKPKAMITACIHGNEPLSTSTLMGWIGSLLGDYGADPAVKEILDTREILFVPVVSPDSYPNSRHVDGVDPNRDFPGPQKPNHQSVAPVKALQSFFLAHRPKSVISGHTFGRVFLTPYGDNAKRCDNESDYTRIVGQMQSLSGYGWKHSCELYGRPIIGSEVDWYYRNGSLSMVMEMGTHQQIPSKADIDAEFGKTYRAIIHWLKESTKIEVRNPSVFLSMELMVK